MPTENQWTLWRQDDNGNSTIIGDNLEKEVAESSLQELEARGHKQHYWIEPSKTNSPPRLNLVVLRSQNIEASKEFYELLGLTFTLHQHGKGAKHYACETIGFTFEIYPTKDEPSKGARIGFSISGIDELVAQLITKGHTILSAPKDSPWGRRAVVQDPDGHSVELTS